MGRDQVDDVTQPGDDADGSEVAARRAFLKNCAKYAAGMPPAITLLLSADSASATHNPPGCSFGNPQSGHCVP